MTKREYCQSHESIAYYSGFNGLEVKGIEHGIDDFVYCVSGAWGGPKGYHKLKIQGDGIDRPFVRLNGHKVPLDECIRMNVG